VDVGELAAGECACAGIVCIMMWRFSFFQFLFSTHIACTHRCDCGRRRRVFRARKAVNRKYRYYRPKYVRRWSNKRITILCICIRILLCTDETIRTQIGRPTGQKNKNWRFCVWVYYYYMNSRVRRRRKWNRWRKMSVRFSTMRSGNYRGRRTAKERRRKCNFDAVASRDLGTRHAVHLKHDIYCIWLYSSVLELNT